MEINVRVRESAYPDNLSVDIHIDDMSVRMLSSLNADSIRDMVRPQVEAILYDIKDPDKRKEFAKAIVDGTPMSRSSSSKDESDGQASSNSDTPPRTEEGS